MVSQKIAPTTVGAFFISNYMHQKIIITAALFSALVLALFHEAALNQSWYYYYPAIDIPIHILGGFAVGLLVFLLLVSGLRRHIPKGTSRRKQLYVIVFGTLIISVVWEVLELVLYLTNDAGLSHETMKDILFGGVGAVLAWVFIQILPKGKGGSY